ncbi:hypothetical protein N9L68_08355, partial [bacterium]|nr:hypothetical protein [bacterium]
VWRDAIRIARMYPYEKIINPFGVRIITEALKARVQHSREWGATETYREGDHHGWVTMVFARMLIGRWSATGVSRSDHMGMNDYFLVHTQFDNVKTIYSTETSMFMDEYCKTPKPFGHLVNHISHLQGRRITHEPSKYPVDMLRNFIQRYPDTSFAMACNKVIDTDVGGRVLRLLYVWKVIRACPQGHRRRDRRGEHILESDTELAEPHAHRHACGMILQTTLNIRVRWSSKDSRLSQSPCEATSSHRPAYGQRPSRAEEWSAHLNRLMPEHHVVLITIFQAWKAYTDKEKVIQ